jgi:hypothetical protein
MLKTLVFCTAIAVCDIASAADNAITQHRSIIEAGDPACVLTPRPVHERFIALTEAAPQILTNLVFADEPEEAGLVPIRIEQKEGQMALVMLAGLQDQIIAFDDPNGRVARITVVAKQRDIRVGIIGIPRDRISFESKPCAFNFLHDGLHFYEQNARHRTLVSAVLARTPEVVLADKAAGVTILPVGVKLDAARERRAGSTIYIERGDTFSRQRIEFGPNGKALETPIEIFSKAEIDQELLMRIEDMPGGITTIDPVRVVSPVKVTVSQRMPSAAPQPR